ncbi:ELWxxDGT repeat protein [Algibacter sp. R77976]|uniref:ELWxxDGT repeat protein n=1 Tax=Algibacter sp. R77976 TaxID=3093873 RepID=UPI0037C93515
MAIRFLLLLTAFFIANTYTSAQTFIKEFYSITEFTSSETHAYFVANDLVHGSEIWRTDGTKENTYLIKDINKIGETNPSGLFLFKNELYFSADDGVYQRELWKTDGTERGTVMVKDINSTPFGGSNPSQFRAFNNELYFVTQGYNRGLWKTDGTETGTVKVLDTGFSDITRILVVNDKLYLLFNGLQEFDTLTKQLTKIDIDEFPNIYEVNVFNNDLYFITSDSYYRRNFRLYKFDINQNITLLQEFNEPQFGDIDIHNLTLVGDEVYFSITTDSGTDRDVLWKTDGTFSGTAPVKSFVWRRHLSNSNISDFIEFKNELYFRSGTPNDYNLWKSDGTESGSVEVFDQSLSRYVDMFIYDDFLYFGSSLSNLWYTDGTSEYKVKFSDLSISTKNSDDLFNLATSYNKIFFEANFQDNLALFSNELNPLMEVYKRYGVTKSNEQIHFETKIDSTDVVKIAITNKGNKDLVFSKIEIIGQGFYLDEIQDANPGNQNSDNGFSRVIAPNQEESFNVIFYPSNEGLKKGALRILSNDLVAPEFELPLIGYADAETGEVPADDVSLKKEITFNTEEELVVIDNSSIAENSPINTSIGTLSVLNVQEDFSFAFIDIDSFSDNQYFTINNNILKLSTNANYELKNTYSIKIKATQESGEVFEGAIVVNIEDVYEPPVLEECSLDANNLGYGLNAVKFLKDQEVIAIGNFGAILKSNDAGSTWRRINTSFKNHLYNIQFVTDNLGYAIGDKIVLKTEDAGETWFKLNLYYDSYPSPNNLFFLNQDFGFVFGNDGKIFKTTDGGRYWKYQGFSFTDLNSAYFFNELKGFLVGNSKTIFSTIDSGETWQTRVLDIEGLRYDTSFTNIYFVNDSTGFISGNRGEILKTDDGGDTWELLATLENPMAIFDLVFQEPSLGFALGERGVFKTMDGGETWSEENLEYRYSGLQSVDISKDGNRSCVVGHGISCCGGASTGHIIYTKEFDDEWEINAYLSLRSSALNAIYFEGNHGLVFGRSYGAQTKDGGVTWQEITPPEEYIYQVDVVNNHIYLLGQNNIYKSSNSGADWDVVSSSNRFRELNFINEQTIYGITYGEGVFKTSDGGVNWVKLGSAADFGVTLNFIDENKGYVGGVNDGLYRTVNGGESWTQVVTGSPESTEQLINVYAVGFFNEIGFAGSSKGLLKTIDDGVTWVNINKNLGGEVKFIHALSELKWYVIAGGRFLMTENGGESWETQYYDEEVEDAHFTKDKVYLAGYRHLIELGSKNEPLVPGLIEGDNFTATQSTEMYSVVSNLGDVYYNWTVSGDNEIIARRNKANVLWKTPGKHIVTVSSYNNCSESIKRELEVTVEDVNFYPSIEGPSEVKEFSSNSAYFTQLNENSRYSWFAEGSQSISSNKNKVSIDWGAKGDAKVVVVETNETSGIRQKAVLNVIISDSELSSSDDFNFAEDVWAYPNPTSGHFEIALPVLKNDIRIEVYTLQSQLISSSTQRVINGKIKLDFSSLSNGLYFIRVYLNTPVTLKILKN